jgi:hypothetical protein
LKREREKQQEDARDMKTTEKRTRNNEDIFSVEMLSNSMTIPSWKISD